MIPQPPSDATRLSNLLTWMNAQEGECFEFKEAKQTYDFVKLARYRDRDTNKQLLETHIKQNDAVGARMEELRQVLPALSRSQIQVLLREMVRDGRVHVHGTTRAARWHLGPTASDCNHP